MSKGPTYPSLYQVNTRVWLAELSNRSRKKVTLDRVPDQELDDMAAMGMDWVWLLGIWQTGPAGREVSLTHPDLRKEYQTLLPDFSDGDVCGSPFAIREYKPNKDFGTAAGLARLRKKLNKRGLKLMLDFVPNHLAMDHSWVKSHPEYFIHGSREDIEREPNNYREFKKHKGSLILAHGRDPYYPGWTDTLQLNYFHAGLRKAMTRELVRIASLCDGLRCDMAMLLLPDIIRQTWGERSTPSDGSKPVDTEFWPEAIAKVRKKFPGFVFLAEVYWDLEWRLQQLGFDFTYDKKLYDRLAGRDADGVRGHLGAERGFQDRLARFLENHDEPRAAAVFPGAVQQAAAAITYLTPGLRFFHEGQFEGRRTRTSIHLGRRRQEEVDAAVQEMYRRLLGVMARPEVRLGNWSLLECQPAWDGNATWLQFVTFAWDSENCKRLVVAVNFAAGPGQCYVRFPAWELAGKSIILRDLTGPAEYQRDGTELMDKGLYLDLPEWGSHVFEVLVC